MDWNALSAVGTTAGSLITAFTVILAYKQYRLSVTSKLKINIKIKQKTICNNILQDFIEINFINHGVLDIQISDIFIKGNKKYYSLRDFSIIDSDNGKNKFPIIVTNKCLVSVEIPKAILQYFVKNIMGFNLESIQKIHLIIVNGKGKEYKRTIPL